MAAPTLAVPQQRLWHCALGCALFLAGSVLLAQDLSETAAKLSPEELVAMEHSLQSNRDDLKVREILISYYTLNINKGKRFGALPLAGQKPPRSRGRVPRRKDCGGRFAFR